MRRYQLDDFVSFSSTKCNASQQEDGNIVFATAQYAMHLHSWLVDDCLFTFKLEGKVPVPVEDIA